MVERHDVHAGLFAHGIAVAATDDVIVEVSLGDGAQRLRDLADLIVHRKT
jgi:hypothetical protein